MIRIIKINETGKSKDKELLVDLEEILKDNKEHEKEDEINTNSNPNEDLGSRVRVRFKEELVEIDEEVDLEEMNRGHIKFDDEFSSIVDSHIIDEAKVKEDL